MIKVSFQPGFKVVLIFLVFCFSFTLVPGRSFSFTYGSASPFGSIGIRFFASITAAHHTQQHLVAQNNAYSVNFLIMIRSTDASATTITTITNY